MPRFSAAFGLTLSQAELDFVDVELDTDNRLYVDPYAIQIRKDEWSAECGDLIRSFFNAVLDALRSGQQDRAEHLFSRLHEPNETFLGQSRGKPSGRGVGDNKAQDFLKALRRSRAFTTGVLADVSEAELFIAGVGPDTVSDLTTNILRHQLAEYTKTQCVLHNIRTHQVVSLGAYWSINESEWVSIAYELPVYRGQPVLLVPKFSVRLVLSLDSQEFWNFHMIEFLKMQYLQSGSALVQTFKNGKSYVRKSDVKELHPHIKDDLAEFVLKNPQVLELYKKLKTSKGPISDGSILKDFNEQEFATLLATQLKSIAPGSKGAGDYHTVILGISTFLFYPQLICPVKEHEIHQGRKRIDIKFGTTTEPGFFNKMLQSPQTRAIKVLVECKNYSTDIANPELDQMTSRFGHTRGFFGMIFCRSIEDRKKIEASCRDAALDGRGYMLVLDDEDVKTMLLFVASLKRRRIDDFLERKFHTLSA